MSRPYKYQKLEGDEKIRLLNIDPGTTGERVRATLIPAAFHEDRGCVAPLKPEPSDAADDKTNQTQLARWVVSVWCTVTPYILRALCWIRRVEYVPPPPTPRKPPIVWETIKYDAVSWAWGSPTPKAEIEIMGENRERWTFEVSQKLEEALKAVRSPNTLRTVWIDAICIDQTNVHEKSHQVPMMDRIYGLADKVCVWLGPLSDTHDAKTAFWLLKEILNDMDYKKTIKKCDVIQLTALSGLMRRDWFSRRWIIQEIALAKKAVVFCDKDQMDWVEFAQAIELFVDGESKTKLADNATLRDKSIPHYWKNVAALGAARLVRDISAIRRLAPNTRSPHKHELLMSLEEIVCRLETFKTSKPHDTVYAYLALAKDAVPIAHLGQNTTFSNKLLQALKAFDMTKVRARAFIVDYNQPYAEICRQFIQFAIQSQSNRATALDIFCRPWAYEEEDHAKRTAMGMPKWVTTIASAPFEMTSHDGTLGLYRRNGDPFVGPPGKPPYNAAGGSHVNDRILKFTSFSTLDYHQKPDSPPAVHSIIVTGFILDRIDLIKDKVTSGALGAVVPEEWLTLGGWLDITQPPPDALWRTLVGDRGPNGSSCPLSYPLCCAEALRLSQSVRNLETSAITSHPERYESFVAGFCSRVQEVVVNRRMIRTKALGKLGLVSGREQVVGSRVDGTGSATNARSIRKGDMICILHGCSVPVVLRRVRKSKEMMDHEARECDRLLEPAAIKVQKAWRLTLKRRRKRQYWLQRVLHRASRRISRLWWIELVVWAWELFYVDSSMFRLLYRNLVYPVWSVGAWGVPGISYLHWIATSLTTIWRLVAGWIWFRFGVGTVWAWLGLLWAKIRVTRGCVANCLEDLPILWFPSHLHLNLISTFWAFIMHENQVSPPQRHHSDYVAIPPQYKIIETLSNATIDRVCLPSQLQLGHDKLSEILHATLHKTALRIQSFFRQTTPTIPWTPLRFPSLDYFTALPTKVLAYVWSWLWMRVPPWFQKYMEIESLGRACNLSRYRRALRVVFLAMLCVLLLRRIWYCIRWARKRYKRLRRRGSGTEFNFVPRYQKEYYYDFLGECYIDGMMDGYAITLQNNSMEKGYRGEKMPNMVFELR
ncbi:hypothetical protein MFIFM68171_00009 [Madurella fahalii]|uniref:Heterokaryon incompatibility domain-containing protein n=1 Tax=Madurella fahalii TaxID=1157608 RepID=A0ABQ0FWB9_9PEZI